MTPFLELFSRVHLIEPKHIKQVMRQRTISFCIVMVVIIGYMAGVSAKQPLSGLGFSLMGFALLGYSGYLIYLYKHKETYRQLRHKEQHQATTSARDAKSELLAFATSLKEKQRGK